MIEVIGTSSTGRSGHRSCHISRDTCPCSSETPFAYADVRSAKGVRPNRVSSGCTLPSAANSSHVKPQRSASGSRFRRTSSPSNTSLPGRDGRVRREDGGRAQTLERLVLVDALVLDELAQPFELEECRMAFVEVEDGRLEPELAQHADAADAEHDLLAEPVLAVAAVERVGDVARPVGISLDLRVEEVERHAADLRAPDAEPHRDELAVARSRAATFGAIGTSSSGQPARVVPRIALDLAVALVEPLPEVAAAVVEADADERNAELGRRLQVVAGEHAEAAGVDRQPLVEAELGREVGDEHVVRAVVLLPPGDALGLRLQPLLDAAEPQRVLGRQRAARSSSVSSERSAVRLWPSSANRCGSRSAKSWRAPGVQLNEKSLAISASAARSDAPS